MRAFSAAATLDDGAYSGRKMLDLPSSVARVLSLSQSYSRYDKGARRDDLLLSLCDCSALNHDIFLPSLDTLSRPTAFIATCSASAPTQHNFRSFRHRIPITCLPQVKLHWQAFLTPSARLKVQMN